MEPVTRRETFLNNAANGDFSLTPITREESFINKIAEAVESGGGSSLPPVTSSDNGKVLGVDNGAWGPMDAVAVVTMDEATGTFSYADEQFDLIQKYGRFVMKTINEDVPVYVIGTLYDYGNYYVSSNIALFRNNPVAICTGKLKLEKSPKRGSFLDHSSTQAYFGDLDRITVPVPENADKGKVLMVPNSSGTPHFSWESYYPAQAEFMDEQSVQVLQLVLASLSASAATSGSASAYMPQDNSALFSLLNIVVVSELKHFMIRAGSYVFYLESFTLDSLVDNIETATFICSYVDTTNDFLHFTVRLALTASYTALIVDCKTVPLISM